MLLQRRVIDAKYLLAARKAEQRVFSSETARAEADPTRLSPILA